MKKFDIKKIGIIIAVIVVVVLAIFLIGKLFKGNVSEESLKQYEERVEKYYMNLSGGLNTPYNGLEALYQADEIKAENLSDRQLIRVAISYISGEGKLAGVDNGTLTLLYKDKYPEIEKSTIYSAKEIREAIKVLFGIENFANPTIVADATSLTNYTYLAEEDLYLEHGDYTNSNRDVNLAIDYKIVETVAKKDKVVTTVAIAYVQKNEDKKIYASDMAGEKVVAKDCIEFPSEKIDEFQKYEFTLTKTKDGKNYIFESVKKVK